MKMKFIICYTQKDPKRQIAQRRWTNLGRKKKVKKSIIQKWKEWEDEERERRREREREREERFIVSIVSQIYFRTERTFGPAKIVI